MTINEIIRELKANRINGKAREFLPNDVQSYLKCNPEDGVDMYTDLGRWVPGCSGDLANGIYSLPPDYPELPPPVVEGWVEVPVDDKGMTHCSGIPDPWMCSNWRLIGDLHKLSHFGGYRWSDNRLTLTARGVDGRGSLSVALKRWVKPATPVALRFWCTDVQKFKQAQTRS